MVTIICQLIFGFISILLLLWIYLRPNYRTRQLAKLIPGPECGTIFSSMALQFFYGPGAFDKLDELIKIHGPVFRIWTGNYLTVFIASPEDSECILSNPELIDKSPLYRFLHNWLGTGLLTSTGAKWHKRRKALTSAFHFKILEQFINVFNEKSTILVDCLREKASGQVFDVYPHVVHYTLDVLFETAMDAQINAQKDTDSRYSEAFRMICHQISERVNKPWLYNDFIYAITGNLHKENKYLKILRNLSEKVIKNKEHILKNELKSQGRRRQPDEDSNLGIKTKTAFLELLLRMKLEGSDTFREVSDVREEVDTFLFEGHDTTTSALCFAVHCLAKYPDIQSKIYEEQMSILGEHPRTPRYEDLKSMKYLEWFIKEVLRLYPSVPYISRLLKKEVTLPSGITLPEGCFTTIYIYGCNRSNKSYVNPTEFNPENFSYEMIRNRHSHAYIPFSAGPRNCIGQKYAMLEIKAAISKLVINYQFELPEDRWDVVLDARLILRSYNGYKIKLKPRQI